MPAPRENPLRFVPRTVSDTVDGDNSPPGACMSLSNLIWAPDTPGVLVCRPANEKQTDFSGLSSPGVVSVAFELNGIIYGMIASSSPSGHDRPFAYDVAGSSFQTISGITSANTPTTQATSGAWTPPTMDMVGTRIIVTHPGFNYVGGYAFGYFDLSGYSGSLVLDTVSGSPTLHGSFAIASIGPGYTITGAGIPANTTVLNVANVNFNITGTTHGTTTIDGIASTANLFVGQSIAGSGIPTGATIATIVDPVSITISAAATASATVTLAISGQTIAMSANATATANGITATVAGGTSTAPLWAAGNTTGNLQLAAVPQAVKNFTNRAYFATGNNLVFTDSLSLNISNAGVVQVLTVGDKAAITGLGGLPYETTSGGTLQALIAFKPFFIQAITGDSATSDLSQNEISNTVGTSAPRTITQTPNGLLFAANDGIRNINLIGKLSEPDTNLAVPFIFALYPSRMCAAFNSDVYRICTQNSNALNAPFQEYQYTTKYQGWTGPHTFRADCYAAYGNDFIVFNNALPATMWQSFSVQGHNAEGNLFIENNVQLTWSYQTSPMTDLGNMYANGAVRSTFFMALPATGDTYTFQALDSNSGVLALASLTAPSSQAIWLDFDWGDGTLWGAQQYGLQPLQVPWTQPLIFNELVFQASGNSSLNLKVGALYIGYEKLRYLKQ